MNSSFSEFSCALHPSVAAPIYCCDDLSFLCLEQCLEAHNGHRIIPSSKLNAANAEALVYSDLTIAITDLTTTKIQICEKIDEAISQLYQQRKDIHITSQIIKKMAKQLKNSSITKLANEKDVLNGVDDYVRMMQIKIKKRIEDLAAAQNSQIMQAMPLPYIPYQDQANQFVY